MKPQINPTAVMESRDPLVYSKLKVGTKTIDDATLDLGSLKKANPSLVDKDRIRTAIDNKDYNFLRDVSDFFFETSGYYGRLVRYLAYLYRFDWMVVPYINSDSVKQDKVLTEFSKVLNYLDSLGVKKIFGDISLSVIKKGVYYGYRIDNGVTSVLQELPASYCRSRYFVNGRPLVEFNVQFFDDNFRDINQKMNVLKSFPKEFAKGYIAYKEGKLKQEPGDMGGWIVLDSEYAIKFNLNGSDMPIMISVIPALIELDEAKDLDKKKMMQELLKIVIQKMPLDKNGELIFDVDEAMDLHNNAVEMLGRAVGVDVLTTFADVEVANMSDKNSSTSVDDLQKVERGVYNEAGISQMLFATDGNLALDKSISNDEATVYNLLLQFESYLNSLLGDFNKAPKKIVFRVSMLTTTIYNYKEMAKLYKEQATLGYSKMLPQIALGQSQSSILATAFFENEMLNLSELMMPLQSSNTMAKGDSKEPNKKSASAVEKTESAENGRPPKPDDEKSEKTIANKESMS